MAEDEACGRHVLRDGGAASVRPGASWGVRGLLSQRRRGVEAREGPTLSWEPPEGVDTPTTL